MPFVTGTTISEIFLNRYRTTPQSVGFSFKSLTKGAQWNEVTFGEHFESCKKLSAGLKSLGMIPGTKVAILSETRYEWHLLDMAIIAGQGISVPIYPSVHPDEQMAILQQSETEILIVENDLLLQKIAVQLKAASPNKIKTIVVIDGDSSENVSLSELKKMGHFLDMKEPHWFEHTLRKTKPQDIFTICYTSGTSGKPKGVMLSHSNMVSVLEDCKKALGKHVNAGRESILSFLPYSHIFGRIESFSPHLFEWTVHYSNGFNNVSSGLVETQPSFLFAVPRFFEKTNSMIQQLQTKASPSKRRLYRWAIDIGTRYWENKWQGESSLQLSLQYQVAKRLVFDKIKEKFGGRLKYFICGGAPLSPWLSEFYQVLGMPILEGYGLTETCAPVTLNTPKKHKIGTVGRPLDDVEIRIADDGEILISSKKVFQGYYQQDAETQKAFNGKWFKTGDIGYLDQDGYLHIKDRKKDIIVTSSGKNVAPQKIEELAKNEKLIREFVVLGDRKNYLTALLTLDREAIIKHAQKNDILFSEYSELVKNRRIQGLIQKSISNINSQLSQFETIKKFRVLPQDFSVESGELTPSLKVKREFVGKKFAREYDSMYTLD